PAAVNVVLNAGTLHVRAQALKSAALLGDAIVWVSEAGQGADRRERAPAPPPFRGGGGGPGLAAGRLPVPRRARVGGPPPVRGRSSRERRAHRHPPQCSAPAAVRCRPGPGRGWRGRRVLRRGG